MEQTIRDFLLKEGNINSLLLSGGVILFFVFLATGYVIYEKFKFRSVWSEAINSLIDELNGKGLEVANTLIQIATISANVESALVLGGIKRNIEDKKHKPDFYKILNDVIEGIHDNNYTKGLNGDYAKARNSIRRGVALIKEFSVIGDYEKLMLMAVQLAEAIKNISESTDNLKSILYNLRPHEEMKEELAV